MKSKDLPLFDWRRWSSALAGAAVGVMLQGVAQAGDADASGQAAADKQGTNEDLVEVVVTGTRIRRPNLQSAAPIATIDATEIRDQGAIAVETFLKAMPQIQAAADENQSNGSDGTASIDLRGLGSGRSLTLIDGQRFLPTQGGDLNFIPGFLIQRTDVLTGGASSVYGSDAMSGVVNFVLDKHLNGMRFDAQLSEFQHHNGDSYLRSVQAAAVNNVQLAPSNVTDGAKVDFNLALGSDLADHKGNITGYFGYRRMSPVLQASRDVSACALYEPDPSSFACGGSSNHAYGHFMPLTGPNAFTDFANAKDGSKVWVPNDATFRYNYAPLNYFQRNSERYQGGAFLNLEFSPKLRYSGNVMFMNDHSVSQVAPSAIWNGRAFTVNCDNPYLSDDQRTKLCGDPSSPTYVPDATTWVSFRAATGPGRRNDMRHTDYRLSSALSGDLSEAFSYNASFMYAETVGAFNYQNDINQDKAANALQAILQNGQVVCRGGQTGCVPIDVFSSKGPSAAGYQYIYAPTFTTTTQDIRVFNAYVNGDLGKFGWKLPTADQGLSVVLGVEDRAENYDQKFDETQLEAGSVNAHGRTTAREIFSELDVPLLAHKPAANSLDLSLGYRQSTFGAVSPTAAAPDRNFNTWKVELRYEPVAGLLVRGSYNKAVRAPNTNELFAPQGVGNVDLIDPCANGTQTATLAQCQRTGVTAAQYNLGIIPATPADVGSALGGGNPNLAPETAKTKTVGVVWHPQSLRGFSASVDYFDIRITGYIGTIDASVSLNKCINTGDSYYCSLIHRDPATGALFGPDIKGGYVIATNLNTGFLHTTGYDVTAAYSLPLPVGELNFDLMGTALGSLETQPLPGEAAYDCAGLFGPICGQPSAKWRHNLRTTWKTPWSEGYFSPKSVSLNWRYYGGTTMSRNTTQTFLQGNPSVINGHLPAYNYLDLSADFGLPKKLSVIVGINNLLDKAPPAIDGGLLAENGNGNTYSSTYDALGRLLFVHLSASY